MTHAIGRYEFEIIEQRANGNWLVLEINTGKMSEVSNSFMIRNTDPGFKENTRWIKNYLENKVTR